MRCVAALVLALLVLPVGAAQGHGGLLEAIGAQDGLLAGAGLVLNVGGLDGTEAFDPVNVHGRQIQVETRSTVYGTQALDSPDTAWPDKASRGWSEARATIKDARPGLVLFLHAAPGDVDVRFMDPEVTVAGHDQESVLEPSTTPNERALARADTTTLHQVRTTTGILRITGNFTLSLWNGDVEVQDDSSSVEYWSGERALGAPVGPMALLGRENQRVYLDVTGGAMQISLDTLQIRDFFVAAETLEAASATLYRLDQGPLAVNGPLRLGLGPVHNGTFGTQPLSVVLDEGVGSAGSKPTSAIQMSTEEGLFLKVLAFLSVAASGLLAWRRVRLIRLRRSMGDGDYRSVAAGVGLERGLRIGPEVVVVRVVAMLKTQAFQEAGALLTSHGARLAPAVCAYLWACVHVGLGADEKARKAAMQSILADPAMAVEVASNRSLRVFLAEAQVGGYS